MAKAKLLYTARSENAKTGNVPTAWIGPSIEEARKTCDGCPLLETSTCYAHNGTPRTGAGMIYKTAKWRPKAYTLKAALKGAHPKARFVRMTGLGDLARIGKRERQRDLREIRASGFGVLGYTHFWREARGADLREEMMASCNNPQEADEALNAGWIPAAIVPEADGAFYTTPGGAKLVVCPAQRKPGKVTCNNCGLCDRHSPAWEARKVDGVAFIAHGVAQRRLREATAACEKPKMGRQGKRLPSA